jgi:heme/copper-type cytochrome/quinol oxidase subunit 2
MRLISLGVTMRPLIPVSLLVMLTVSLSSAGAPHPSPDATQVVNLTAKKYEFDPSTIRVKQGTKIQLKITATDHAHGFKISDVPDGGGKPGLVFASSQDCVRIGEGQSATVEFVAQYPGTYSFRCCVHCGWRHRDMKGEVVVEP